jgi:hypothetical protein
MITRFVILCALFVSFQDEVHAFSSSPSALDGGRKKASNAVFAVKKHLKIPRNIIGTSTATPTTTPTSLHVSFNAFPSFMQNSTDSSFLDERADAFMAPRPTTRLTSASVSSSALKPGTFLRRTQRTVQELAPPKRFRVFCDLDGVLVDFEKGIRRLFPDEPHHTFSIEKMHRSTMWARAAKTNSFFEHLAWAPGGKQLWDAIQHLEPDILTGCPAYRDSRTEKFKWCQRELGLDQQDLLHVDMAGHFYGHRNVNGVRRSQQATHIITCWSYNKYHESGPGAVLIDDRISLKAAWEKAGGIFIFHRTGDVDATLRQLYDHGILQEDASDFQ